MSSTSILLAVILLLVVGGLIFILSFIDQKTEEVASLRAEIRAGVLEIDRLKAQLEEITTYQAAGFVTKSSHPPIPLLTERDSA